MKKILLSILLAVLVVGSFWAYAETKGAGDHKDWHHHNRLNLTPDQQKQMEAVMKQVHNDLFANKLEEKKKKIELSQLLLSGNPDKSAIDQKLQEILALKGQKQQIMENAYFNTLAFLNPDQRQTFSKLAAMHVLGGRHQGHDRGCGGGKDMKHSMHGSMHHHDAMHPQQK